MPLSETAQKYAQAIFATKVQELSRDYESKVVAAKKNVGDAAFANRNAITAKVVGLKAQMLAGQVRAKADALQAAYEKDGKPVDAEVLEEIMRELQAHAQIITQSFIGAEQFEGVLQAQRTRSDAGMSARHAELVRSTDRMMHQTLAEIQQALQAKIYEKQLESQSPNKRATKPANSPHASEWHPEIEKVSRELFHDSHYREAVLNSYIRVIEAVKQKSRIQDDGDSLMGRAFGCDLGRLPKVQFNPCQTQADIDEQKGIMFLFKGVVGMRNFKAHTIRLFDDEQRAREYLSLSSLLMRLLDLATVNP
jgi:uncharacterized protein (TIGR02391 family)